MRCVQGQSIVQILIRRCTTHLITFTAVLLCVLDSCMWFICNCSSGMLENTVIISFYSLGEMLYLLYVKMITSVVYADFSS